MMMDTLRQDDGAQVVELFCKCFMEDSYYAVMFPEPATRADKMKEAFTRSISYCIGLGTSLGIRREGTLVAFALCFDYHALRQADEAAFRMIFTSKKSGDLPYDDSLHARIRELNGDVMYLMSIAVDPALRRRELASGLLDAAMRRYPRHHFVSDVSNPGSLEIYRRRNFRIIPLDTDYDLVIHPFTEPAHSFAVDQTVKVIVPSTRTLEENGIAFRVIKDACGVCGFRRSSAFGIDYVLEDPGSVTMAAAVELAYGEYLKYQRLINVAQYTEYLLGDRVLYALTTPYLCKPLYNDVLEQMLPNRQTEWSLIPDIYVSVPVRYRDRTLLEECVLPEDKKAAALLRDMDFRTHYEAGVPSSEKNVDDLAGFKQRIRRFYLGKLRIQITTEVTVDQYEREGEPIGAAALVDLYISIDRKSGCAVLTWYTLSAPFLISHLMDNIIRNQVMVIGEQGRVNLYDHLAARFQISKCGTPKIYTVIPRDKVDLKPSQIASLLAAETIYPEGETFGEIIDPEIMGAVTSENGMGQYNRAFVCAYSNVMLQFAPDMRASLRDRMCEESIALFYIELILFEEAAIRIADQQIVGLLTTASLDEPVEFLAQVDRINDEYTKTSDFWNIQVNYPTSQKSINMLRGAFRIDERLESMKRNQEQLQTVFTTKCEIVDRRESKRMDKSLATLSVLAIFSAWMDSYDYLSTWSDVFSGGVIRILQKVLFGMILVIGAYVLTHLFGGKFRRLFRAKRQEKRRRKEKKAKGKKP